MAKTDREPEKEEVKIEQSRLASSSDDQLESDAESEASSQHKTESTSSAMQDEEEKESHDDNETIVGEQDDETDFIEKIEKNNEDRKNKRKKVRKLDLSEVEDFNAKLRRRGVLYISHIPPQMGPNKVKTLLSNFGTVTRVYLVPEDQSARKRRQQQTGKKGGSKRYVEGWVEYEDRKIAKRVGMCLNNTPISNFKRSVHYGQMWNVKFLRKFQWSHLTEKVSYERRVKEHKLKIEMMQVKKENAAYKNLVERGQLMDRIEARKKRKKSDSKGYAKKFKFRQNKPMDDTEPSTKSAVLGSLMKG